MATNTHHKSHITFLVGKPLARGSMIAGVVERAHHHWATVTLHRPTKGTPLPEGIFETDLIVQRGLSVDELASIEEVEASGVRCINRIFAAIACADRWSLMSTLGSGGVPIPETHVIHSWPEVYSQRRGIPTVVKTLDGKLGRGANVVLTPDGLLPSREPFPGPFVVQEYLAGNPTVTKVYVAGEQMRGIVKRSLIAEDLDHNFVVPFEVSDELRELSSRVADVMSLDIFGVDFLDGPHGPAVIDVNPFPSFRGIPEAHRIVSEHVMDVFQDTVGG